MRGSILRYKSATFEGAGLFKTPVHVELEKQGIVAIIGDEGAGKSTIPEVITNNIWGQGSPRVRTETLTERTIANLETGYVSTVHFESGFDAQSRDIEITQSYKHPVHKSKYVIAVNGDSKSSPTTKPEQKKLLARIAPLAYDEWLGVGYLHQGGIHSLLSGTKAAKRAYLTAVFGLSFWEDLIIEAKNEAKMFNGFTDQSLELSSQLATLADEESAINAAVALEPDPEEIAVQVASLTEKLQTFAAKVARLSALATTAEQYQAAKTKLANIWPTSEDPADTRLFLSENIKTNKAKVKALHATLEEKVVQRTAYSTNKKATDKAQKLLQEATAALALLQEKTKDLPSKEELNACEELLATAAQIGVTPAAAPDGKTSDLTTEEAEEAVRAAKASHDKLLKLRTKLGADCTCPTCGSQLTDVEEMLAAAVKQLAKQRRLASWAFHKHGAVWTTAEVSVSLAGHGALAEAATKEKAARLAWVKAEKESANLTEVTAEEVEAVRQDIASCNETLEADIAKRDNADAALRQKETIASLAKSLADVNIDTLLADKDKAKERQAKTQQVHTQAMDAKRRVDQSTARLASIKSQRMALTDKIAKVAHLASMAEKYEKEVIPYLSALRSARVRERVGVLEAVLPAYLKEMSTSQYEGSSMKLHVSEDLEEIDLIMRPSKFNHEVLSVQASGGQRRRFTLALIGAIREVSPRTTNAMFFDEPLSDLQSEGKLLFLNRLLPLMLERCPGLESVFVIAHDREVLDSSNTAFSDVWKVTNHGNAGSKITTGLSLSKLR